MATLIVYESDDEIIVVASEDEPSLKTEYTDRDWDEYNRTEHTRGTVSIQTRFKVW